MAELVEDRIINWLAGDRSEDPYKLLSLALDRIRVLRDTKPEQSTNIEKEAGGDLNSNK